MKKTAYNILAVVLSCSTLVFAVGSPIGSATSPSSGSKSGTTSANRSAGASNPYAINGNDIVTGNVGGGKHFRGNVPYRSTGEFWGNQGSSSFNDFYRDTSSSSPYSSNYGRTQSYYLPSKSTTSLKQVQKGATPDNPFLNATGYSTGLKPIRQVHDDTYKYMPTMDLNAVRPVSQDINDVKRKLDKEMVMDLESNWYKPNMTDARKAEITKELSEKIDVSLKPIIPDEPEELSDNPLDPANPDDVSNETEVTKVDVFDVMKAQQELESDEETAPQEREDTLAMQAAKKLVGDMEIKVDHAEASLIRGKHKTFASYAQDKFNTYMRLAEKLMAEGKYYKAADAYTLASIFKDTDPLPNAGKAHALFAAGEYMSSAFYLSEAIRLYPEYVNIKLDMKKLGGDQDDLQKSISEIRQWYDRNGYGELAFVLSYIYYQLDSNDLAIEMIKDAQNKMPESESVKILAKAIEEQAAQGNR